MTNNMPGSVCEVHVTLAQRFVSVTTDVGMRRELEAQIAAGVAQLCKELGLRVAAFEVNVEGGLDASRSAPLEVRVNGQLCRIPLLARLYENLEPNGLQSAVMRAVHANRGLLVTPELSAEAKRDFGRSPGLSSLSATTFHELQRILARRGLPVTYAAIGLNHETGPLPNDAERLYDIVVDWDDLALRLILPPNAERVQKPDADGEPQTLEQLLKSMDEGLFKELGLVLPPIEIDENEDLDPHEFEIQVNEVRLSPFRGLDRKEFLANHTLGELTLFGVEGREAINPATGGKASIVADVDGARQKCIGAGMTIWGPIEYIILCLSTVVRRNASTFLTDEIVEHHLDVLAERFPDLVRDALQRFDLITLTHILRRLLDEDVSIHDLRGVLDALLTVNATSDADFGQTIVFAPNVLAIPAGTRARTVAELTADDYADAVRSALRRYLSHKHTRGRSTLTVYLLDREIEARLAGEPLTSEERAKLHGVVARLLAAQPAAETFPALLTGPDVRRVAREALEREFPMLPILSYTELSMELNIQPIARVEY
jgi:hypothetical protein